MSWSPRYLMIRSSAYGRFCTGRRKRPSLFAHLLNLIVRSLVSVN